MSFLEDYERRGLLAQVTHPEELKEHLNEKRTAYAGFDPTAASLHVGHLLPILNLKRWQDAGHRPIVLMGGGTASIGDPTGKTDMRKMLTLEQLNKNVESMAKQLGQYIDLSSEDKGLYVNNADWLFELNYLDFLREFGPHFSVNRMLGADCYKSRLEKEGAGLSFLEFNYMPLQSYDFYYLNKKYDCTIQLGGDDQWSNMLGGVELIRRLSKSKSFCITNPLLTTSDGKKMGKTEKGALWLDPNMTSPYDFYQYWRNLADADTAKTLNYMTLLPQEQIDELAALEGQEINKAKEVLAYEMTKLVHGEEEADKSQKMARSVFSSDSGSTNAPEVQVARADLADGVDILSFLAMTSITTSKKEARRLVEQSGVAINGEKISDMNFQVNAATIESADEYIVQKGKKKFFKIVLS